MCGCAVREMTTNSLVRQAASKESGLITGQSKGEASRPSVDSGPVAAFFMLFLPPGCVTVTFFFFFSNHSVLQFAPVQNGKY